MANKETTYTVKINTEIADLTEKVTKAKGALDGLLKSGNAPRGLTSALERLDTLLGRIQDQAGMPPSKQMFSGLEKDINKASLAFGDLVRYISSLADVGDEVKIELFPPKQQAKIRAAIEGLKEYGKALAEIAAKEKEVEKARRASEAATGKAKAAKEDKVQAKSKLDKKVARKEGKQAELATLDPEKDATKIAKLSTEISELDIEIKDLTRDFNQASAALTEANKAAKVAKEGFATVSGELATLKTNKLQDMERAATAAGVSIGKIDGEDAVDTMERLGGAMMSFKNDAMSGLPENISEVNEKLKEAPVVLQQATKAVNDASDSWKNYNEEQDKVKDVQQRIKEFLGYAGAAKVLTASFRKAFEATKELDAAMTEIAVVTDFNISDMWDQLPEYTKRANELGISITQAYNASALFYQQGLKTNEVVTLSNETLKMAKIAGLDAAEATDRMTAALRGFNMELDATSAQKISDVYSKLAAITASDVDEISTAMTKTASIASSAGMEFETTAAFLSQIIETTRESAETAGTAMKTVIARFQELKKAPEDIGEVDGEIVDANAIEGALRSVGVSLRDSSGQFRELDDVFLELSSKWDSLDKNTQRYIATIAAGSRQQSRFIAMMQDYGRTQELVNAANNSAGASNKQYEKTMDSLETKLTQLENAWNEFSTSLLNSDAIKAGVDLLTLFITALNKATSAFDGWMGSVSKIGMILSLFRVAKAIFNQFSKKITEVFVLAGNQIGEGIISGMKSKEQEAIDTAEKIAHNVAGAARTGATSTTETTTSEEEETPKEPTKAQKILGKVGAVATAPIRGVVKGAEWVHNKNKEIAGTILSHSQMGKSQKKASIAGDFAENGQAQMETANSSLAGAAVGTTMSSIEGLGSNINALSLPLESMGDQFQAQMTEMGVGVDEAKAKWEELYKTIASGDVTAKEAIGEIDKALAETGKEKGKEASGLTVTEGMQKQSDSMANASTPIASADYKATLTTLSGQRAIANGAEGTSMASTLNATQAGGSMAATDLPMDAIQAQYTEKMAAMDVSTDEITSSWQALVDAITSGNSTASQALDMINGKLEETANKALEAQRSVAGQEYSAPTDAIKGGKTGITNTAATANAAKAKQSQTQTKAKRQKADLNEQNKKNQENQNKAAAKQEKNAEKATKDQKKMIDGYKKLGDSIANTGAALSMAGAGFSALGTKFEESGMTGAAEVFNGLGSALGTVGSVMSVVGSVMGFLTPLMTALTTSTTAQTAATTGQTAANAGQATSWWGVMAAEIGAQTAAWPLLLITLAIVAAIAILVLIIWALVAAFQAAQTNSPEGKLKAAEEAAAAAAETADQAAEAYENLVKAFEELEGKYDALEELTKGTKEWNEAVKDINKSVIDLIQQYPELAKLVENDGGVLKLDVESAEVQNLLKEAEQNMIAAQANAITANLDVIEKTEDVLRKNLTEYSSSTQDEYDAYLLKTKTGDETFDKIAQAVADGAILAVGDSFQATMGTTELQDAYGLSLEQLNKFAKQLKDSGGSIEDATRGMDEYGRALSEGSEQVRASFEAIATSVEGLYDFSGWTDKEVENAQEIFNGDVYAAAHDKYEKIAEEKLKNGTESSSNGSIESNISDEYKPYLYEALDTKYGAGKWSLNGREITYENSDGDDVTETVSKSLGQEILGIMVHLAAQDEAEKSIGATRTAVEQLNNVLDDTLSELDGRTNLGIGTRLFENNGDNITQHDLETLADRNLFDEETGKITNAQALWNKLDDVGKQAFGNFEAFENHLKKYEIANQKIIDSNAELAKIVKNPEAIANAFSDMGVGARTGMIKQATEMARVLRNQGKEDDEISKKVTNVSQAMLGIWGQLPEHLQKAFEDQWANLDLTDSDQLLGFKWDLINMYGLEENAADKLTDSITEAMKATSAWDTQLLTYNALTGAQQDLNDSLRKQTDLQWAYSHALETGSAILNKEIKTIGQLVDEQVDSYMGTVTNYDKIFAAAQQNMAVVYGSGAQRDSKNKDLDYRDLVEVTSEGAVNVLWNKVGELQMGERINMEDFDAYVEELQEIGDSMEEAKEGAKEQIDALKELRDQTKESYQELRDLVKDAVVNKIEEQINLQSETLAATQEASTNLLNSLQTYINEQRQKAQNEKTEQSLQDSLNRQAYLAMDTSNANLLALQQEQKLFDEKAEEYRNTLIDQSIQQLQDANDKAFEQRETQISIAERQLELYQDSQEFQDVVDGLLRDAITSDGIRNSTLYDLLDYQKVGMSEAEKAEWDRSIENTTDLAEKWQITDWDGKIAELQTIVDNIEDKIDIQQEAFELKTKGQAHELGNLGFEPKSYEEFKSNSNKNIGGGAEASTKDYETYLNKYETFKNRSSDNDRQLAGKTADELNGLFGSSSAGLVKTEQDYNKEVSEKINSGIDPRTIETYAQYVDGMKDNYAKQLFEKENKTIKTSNLGFGWFPVQFHGWNSFAQGAGESNELSIDGAGAESDYVAFGPAVTGEQYEFLKQLMKKTYHEDQTGHKLDDPGADTPTGHAQGIYYGGKAYAYYNGTIREIKHEQAGTIYGNIAQEDSNITGDALKQNNNLRNKLNARVYTLNNGATKFKTGGLADFTGPAWLDGTPNRPEYVLNAAQTEKFFSLVDILEDFDDKKQEKKSNGDNYFDIEINVEKIENDYDVERMAEKIRDIIYEDAVYRNVNAINHIR